MSYRLLRSTTTALALSTLAIAGCTGDANDGPIDDAAGKADQISGRDDPSGLLGSAERRLSQLITEADVGQSFGVPDELVPYPDTYWPMVDNGIAVEWLEKDGTECNTFNECTDPEPSPLEKWVSITAPSEVDEAIAWEIKHHGKDVPNVASWFGHCPGWVATAMLNKPIQGPVHVRGNALGLERCEPGSEDCVKFELGDINALGAEAHEGARSRFIGARCDTEPADIERDEFGRIVRNGRGCKGLNAGAMVILMGNRLKNDQLPFAIDAQNDFNTEQIWNQPAFRYTVHRYEELTLSQAANLVATGGEADTGDQAEYPWNSNARGFALVGWELHWVTETSGPNRTVVPGSSSANSTKMLAVIELDAPASDPGATIIGGEYIEDASFGASRLKNAPFAWIAIDVGSTFRHNPFVDGHLVKELIELSHEENGGTDIGGGSACAHDVCTEGGELDASCSDSCAATVCEADSFCCETAWDRLCVNQVETLCARTCE